ncbi:type III pantothenate kinase [Zhouia spongiae]|uniref:Type III pantothenate kinase n=1 Tax=Zhouia spongiae TaxID=2202721 RepID=A0ABY3YQX0_9FLAO|nr:type III pantothenate kinase [Zhouia spongiae]UNZ00145.1 type III pantothenate kinase [Zhouia spongiae]
MNLIVDAGNTFMKLAVFQREKVIYESKIEEQDFLKEITKIFKNFPETSRAIISSVSKCPEVYVKALSVFCKVHLLTPKSKVPFINKYKTPETLGMDRVALVTAAFYTSKSKNTLIIDSGTCITYDFVNANGEYLGGAIAPGIKMRFKALNKFTARLPLVADECPEKLIGNSTETSIASGVLNGMVFEIDGTIDEYQRNFKDLTVILTGGDSHFLSKRLKNTIFANPKILLEGLNYILELNKD